MEALEQGQSDALKTYLQVMSRFHRYSWGNIEKVAEGEWKVEGALTLHGVSKPVTVTAKRVEGAYISHAIIKQTDFGTKPITVGSGLVKVKNEHEIDFRIVARSE